MALEDFAVCFILALASAVFLYFELFAFSVFAGLMFLLLMANIALFHLHAPKPVFLVDIRPAEPEQPEEEEK